MKTIEELKESVIKNAELFETYTQQREVISLIDQAVSIAIKVFVPDKEDRTLIPWVEVILIVVPDPETKLV